MISVPDALEIVVGNVRPLSSEKVSILDSLGRVIAEDASAPRDLPPKDNSAMDGYALRYEDLAGKSSLRVVETIAAGSEASRPLAQGEAMKIMTGAPIPPGADTVVPVENTRAGAGRVEVIGAVSPGAHIRPAGEDAKKGELVVARGARIRPAEVGMLASMGNAFVSVYQRPRVAIISTGEEVVELGDRCNEREIVDANAYALTASVLEAGGVPIRLGIGRDDPAVLAALFKRAFSADVVLSSGGVSVGDKDYVCQLLVELGVKIHFQKVAIKPGKPLVFGTKGTVPVFALPGNPVAAVVGFEQFVRPFLRSLQGHRNIFRPVYKAVLEEEAGAVRKKPGRMEFRRCRIERSENGIRVNNIQKPGSGLLTTLVKANAYLIIPQESSEILPGEEVRVQPYCPEFLEGATADLSCMNEMELACVADVGR